ncbi:hypothetical protein KBA63_02685 [Candidatus Woesebacteria bacterium]|nr:hypothetical protein [Candidatus Woesebacteria bacterium]MBP9687260.1 hypothetical protein [Candidatus Woesebacteria bacterium]
MQETEGAPQSPEKQEKEKVSPMQMEGITTIMSDEFHDQFIAAHERKNTERDAMPAAIELAGLQKVYIESLLKISGGVDCPNFRTQEEADQWNKIVQDAMFDNTAEGSLAQKAKEKFPRMNMNMRSEFSGATSVLTFMDLWQDVYPEGARVSMEVADAETDARRKIDLKVETDTQITLIQLKTNSVPDGDVAVAHVDEIRDYFGDKVKSAHVAIMLTEKKRLILEEAAKAKKDAGYRPKRVRVAIVDVPNIDTNVVGNVFGRINDPEKRKELVDKMRTLSEEKGLLPKAKAA